MKGLWKVSFEMRIGRVSDDPKGELSDPTVVYVSKSTAFANTTKSSPISSRRLKTLWFKSYSL
jgi:hypothetical protein